MIKMIKMIKMTNRLFIFLLVMTITTSSISVRAIGLSDSYAASMDSSLIAKKNESELFKDDVKMTNIIANETIASAESADVMANNAQSTANNAYSKANKKINLKHICNGTTQANKSYSLGGSATYPLASGGGVC